MKYFLYYRGIFQSEHSDFEEARAQARWNYFELRSAAWEGENSPPGYWVVCHNDTPLKSQDNKVVCF